MLTSRRDYLLRILDEVSRILGQIVFKRRAGADQEALETVLVGYQRLFNLDGDQIFLLTPEQHYQMLAEEDSPSDARDKVLAYAALSAEAGKIYAKQGNRAMSRACFLNALRFALRARIELPREGAPAYAPDIAELQAALGDEALDSGTAELVRRAGL
jgi:hypothetical protein